MSNWTEEEANLAARAIAQRSTIDSEFRQLCLSDPVAAVKAETGKDLPENFLVRFIENRGADLTIVLPDLAVGGEISDEELEQVAGGGKCGVGTCGGSAVCVVNSNVCGVTCGGSSVL